MAPHKELNSGAEREHQNKNSCNDARGGYGAPNQALEILFYPSFLPEVPLITALKTCAKYYYL